jgi:hypothetical protein
MLLYRLFIFDRAPPALGPVAFSPDGTSLFVPSPQLNALLKLDSFDGSLLARFDAGDTADADA